MSAAAVPPLPRALAPEQWKELITRRLRIHVRHDGKVQITDPGTGRAGAGRSAAQALHDLDRPPA